MAYIFLHPTNLLTFINSLKDYATSASNELAAVRKSNNDNDDPADVYYDISEYSTHATYHGDLKRKADDLKTRLDEAVAMNNSGVTPMNGELISYYLPDEGEYSEDTAANVKAFNSESVATAKTEAMELDEALRNGTSSKGRTVEEILDEIAKHQDVPTYGETFVGRWSTEQYLDLVERIQQHYNGPYSSTRSEVNNERIDTGISILSHILCAATYDDTEAEDRTAALDKAVTNHPQQMAELNALLMVPDVPYKTDFLVHLADRLEDHEYQNNPTRNVDAWPNGNYKVYDPLAGVFSAMADNPEAAQRYLAPDGGLNAKDRWTPGEESEKRWALLRDRDWSSTTSVNSTTLDIFTSVQAAASSLRGSDNTDQARAATWATAQSMDFAVNNLSTDNYTDTMKENFSVLIANSPDEVVQVAQGGSPDGLGLPGDEDEDKSTLTSLIYRVIDNENAAATISASLANEVIHNDGTSENLNRKYRRAGEVYGYLNAIGSERMEDNTQVAEKEGEATKEAVGTGLSVFSSVVGAGISGAATGPVAPLLWTVGSTVAQPLIVDSLPSGTVPEYSDPIVGSRGALESYAYADAVNRGEIPEDCFDPDYLEDEDGSRYSWYSDNNGRPKFSLPYPLGDQQSTQVHNWANDVKDEDNGHPKAANTLTELDDSIGNGVYDGTSLILGPDGAGGSSTDAIHINK